MVVPPLLRKEVLCTQPWDGGYLHGYLLNSGFSEEVKTWHSKHPEIVMHFFWDKKDVPNETSVNNTLTFHRLSDTLFLHYLAGAKAYASTAGFESVCEAMYLGKPVLMVPTHIEQACNAHDAVLAGAGVSADRFDMDTLLNLSKNYHPNPDFKQWVQHADWLILREFREDILNESFPSIFHRMAINSLFRLSRFFFLLFVMLICNFIY